MHPRSRRCTRSTDLRIRLARAPCERGASAARIASELLGQDTRYAATNGMNMPWAWSITLRVQRSQSQAKVGVKAAASGSSQAQRRAEVASPWARAVIAALLVGSSAVSGDSPDGARGARQVSRGPGSAGLCFEQPLNRRVSPRDSGGHRPGIRSAPGRPRRAGRVDREHQRRGCRRAAQRLRADRARARGAAQDLPSSLPGGRSAEPKAAPGAPTIEVGRRYAAIRTRRTSGALRSGYAEPLVVWMSVDHQDLRRAPACELQPSCRVSPARRRSTSAEQRGHDSQDRRFDSRP
jgi:hypothetical protein